MTSGTVEAAIADATAPGLTRFDAQRLMSHVLDRTRAWLMAHGDDVLDDTQRLRFEALVARHLDDEPIAYLLGDQVFHGLAFDVSPAVLVPRADTEVLVDWALECIKALQPGVARPLDVVDLGTGSGAIAVTVASKCPAIAMTATDLSAAALATAQRNAARHGTTLDTRLGSWWTPLEDRWFDLALSNPPYIAEGDAHLTALRHEPALALVSGPDGLDALRTIVARAPRHLRAGAWLLVEHGFDQAAAVRALFAAAGFVDVASRHDLQRHERCTGGRCPADGGDR